MGTGATVVDPVALDAQAVTLSGGPRTKERGLILIVCVVHKTQPLRHVITRHKLAQSHNTGPAAQEDGSMEFDFFFAITQ